MVLERGHEARAYDLVPPLDFQALNPIFFRVGLEASFLTFYGNKNDFGAGTCG